MRLSILKKMPPLDTTGVTTWCLSGLQWLTPRCFWLLLKISVTLMKLNGQVFMSDYSSHFTQDLFSVFQVIIIHFYLSRATFHPDWNHHHDNSRCPCARRSHFRRHHMRRACQILQDGGPPASARGTVSALWRGEKPICSLSFPLLVSSLHFYCDANILFVKVRIFSLESMCRFSSGTTW